MTLLLPSEVVLRQYLGKSLLRVFLDIKVLAGGMLLRSMRLRLEQLKDIAHIVSSVCSDHWPPLYVSLRFLVYLGDRLLRVNGRSYLTGSESLHEKLNSWSSSGWCSLQEKWVTSLSCKTRTVCLRSYPFFFNRKVRASEQATVLLVMP